MPFWPDCPIDGTGRLVNSNKQGFTLFLEPKPKNNRKGRQPGAVSKRTLAMRKITNEAALEGVTPIEVMLDNMRFYYEKAEVLQVAILDKVSAKGVLKGADAMEMLTEFKKLGEFRMQAQSCAVDASPYIHARLSATTIDAKVTHKVEEAEEAFKTIEHALEAIVTGEIIPSRETKKEKV